MGTIPNRIQTAVPIRYPTRNRPLCLSNISQTPSVHVSIATSKRLFYRRFHDRLEQTGKNLPISTYQSPVPSNLKPASHYSFPTAKLFAPHIILPPNDKQRSPSEKSRPGSLHRFSPYLKVGFWTFWHTYLTLGGCPPELLRISPTFKDRIQNRRQLTRVLPFC